MQSTKQIFTLSTGIQFSVSAQMSTTLIMDIMDSIPDPLPPMVEVPTMGGKKSLRENYSDPDYKARLAYLESKRNIEVTRAIMWQSLKLETSLPDDESWLSMIRSFIPDLVDAALGVNNGKEYLYLRYFGAKTKEDFDLIMSAASVSEKGVADKVDTFQGNA